MAKFQIATKWPSGAVTVSEQEGDGLELGDGIWWLLDGKRPIMGFTPETGKPEHGGRKTIIRIV